DETITPAVEIPPPKSVTSPAVEDEAHDGEAAAYTALKGKPIPASPIEKRQSEGGDVQSSKKAPENAALPTSLSGSRPDLQLIVDECTGEQTG
ncbi:MAG: hypothetical protein WCF79_09755, partial [Rhodomicrobium sp.]